MSIRDAQVIKIFNFYTYFYDIEKILTNEPSPSGRGRAGGGVRAPSSEKPLLYNNPLRGWLVKVFQQDKVP